MGFEIPIDSDYFKHPKTLKLVAILGPRADVFPLRLWAWCSQFAHDGRIRCGKAALEVALGWGRPKGRLHSALVNVGFLESDGETVHDWMEGVGRAILIYDKKKQKQRDKYHLSVGILPEELRKKVGSIPPTLSTLETQDSTTRDLCAEPSKTPASSLEIPQVLRALPLYAADAKLVGQYPALVMTWMGAYPGVNIEAEIAKAHAWEMANPKNRKVNRSRFLNSWLARAQDKPTNGNGNHHEIPLLSPSEILRNMKEPRL